MEPPELVAGPAAPVRAAPGSSACLLLPLPKGTPPFTYIWSRAGATLDDRFTTSEDAGGVRLTVSSAKTGDSGVYTLQASNAVGTDKSKIRLEVAAEEAPTGDDPPTFLRRLQDLTVKVGSRTRFLVEIISSTECKVTWYRNERRLLEAERVALARDGNFWCADVAAVSVDDAGRWTCTAENAGGRASCSAHLNVLVPKAYKRPEFVEELQALLTEQGTVSLECKVVGVPTPVLRWFKDSREIKAGDVFALTANSEDPTSLGTYTCEAVNCMGRAYSSSKVHVVGRASREGSVRPATSGMTPELPPIFTKELEDARVKVCEHLTLGCQIVVPPWPRSVVWYNKEGKVEPGERYHILEDGVGGYLLEILSAEWADEGEWKCVATSTGGRVGISTCYVAMDVPKNYRKPRFMENLQAVLTEEGLVSFECKVVGFPTPVLSWFKDGQELKPGDVYQLTGTNSLGSYCCIARNCMGQASSSAELTVQDIQNQLNEEEKLQLFSKNQAPKFIQGLKSVEAKIDEPFRFIIKVAIPPEPSVLWYRDDQPVDESTRCHLDKEDKGVFNLDIQNLEFLDQAEWKCVAMNDYGHSVTSCFLKLIIPRHYKKPRFLENLQAILSEEGAVNLECKVIGVPQPVLKWYKDGEELKPGDIHRIISGQDGTCCLGTYTCEAQNCMGIAASSASLLGFDDSIKANPKKTEEPPLQRQLSLSTIHEERTSQMYDTPVGDITLDDKGEISFSFDGKEVSVSLYETPDLTEEEALQIVEMYADQLSENITEHNVVELPPLRFVKETSTSGNLLMEAIIIDVSPDYFAVPEEDLRTEADVEDLSIADENGLPLLSLDQDIDLGGEDYLENTMALLCDERSDFPAKSSRKKSDSQRSGDDFFSLSRDQSLSEEKRDDDTNISESELQSFASARSSTKVKSKSSQPPFEEGQESSEPTKTTLLKDDIKSPHEKPTKELENILDLQIVKQKRERRTSRGSRRSSTNSEKSISKSREELLRIKTEVDLTPRDTLTNVDELKYIMNNISSSLTQVINNIQLIERDIILKSELMSSAATASRSLEIISSLITPLSEIHSIADAAKESVSESRDVTSTIFNSIPKPLKSLQQSLTIIEKCIDVESDNKTLVKKTCVSFIENCGTELQKIITDIASVTTKHYLKTEEKINKEVECITSEMITVIKFSVDTIKARNLLLEVSDIKPKEPTLETKHLRDTQKAVFELKSPLNSLLRIVDSAESFKITDLTTIKNSEVIMNDMSASIQDLQTALQQIESLSVMESSSTLQKYNTEIIESVMDSVLKLRGSFEQLSTETKAEEGHIVLHETLASLKKNLTEISRQIETVDDRIGQFDVLQSDNKLDVLQKMAQILIALENNLPRLETLPHVKSHMDTFHKNLTKVLEKVIESNDAKRYLIMTEICDTINILNSSINNLDTDNVLPLASIRNTLKIIQSYFVDNGFESELNFLIINNISDILVGIHEAINKAEEISLQIDSEYIQEFSAQVLDEAKVIIILEHIDRSIAAVDTIKTIESTQELQSALIPTVENIRPVLEELRRSVASIQSSGVEQEEHVSEISDICFPHTIASPLCELNQNLIILNNLIVENVDTIKDNYEVVTAIAEPLNVLHTALEILQQDVIAQYGDDLTSYEISVNMASLVQNLQSCIVIIHEQTCMEAADEMSTLEDISGIKTSADTLPSDRLVLPTAEETTTEQSLRPFNQEITTTATAHTLQTLNEHVLVLQTPEVIETLDSLSQVSDYSSLKTMAVGLRDLHSGIEGILHPVPMEGSIDLEDATNISRLSAIAEPMQELRQSLSILDICNISIYENILDLPADKVHSVIQHISEFKNCLEQCMSAVFPAMEVTTNTIEISSKVSTLREVCEQLKEIFETSKYALNEMALPPEVHGLELVVESLINATDVTKNIKIDQVKCITEELFLKIKEVQEDIIHFTAQTPEKLSQEAKIIEMVCEVETNIAVLEQFDFIDLSRASDITMCASPHLAIEIDSESLAQIHDIAENAVSVLEDSYQEIPVVDRMIVDDFFNTCKNEFTILRCLITKATTHKKIIRLLQEFTSLQTMINNFTTKRLELHLSDDVNECLTNFLIHADECLRTARTSLIKVIELQSDLLIKIPVIQLESMQEFKTIVNNTNTAMGAVVNSLLSAAETSKSLTSTLQHGIIEELSNPNETFTSDEDEIALSAKIEEFAEVIKTQLSSKNIDESTQIVLDRLSQCIHKHDDYKDAMGKGKTLIILKCLADCVNIVRNKVADIIIFDADEMEKRTKENSLKEILTEMIQPLQALQTQLVNIREQALSGDEEDSISIDLTSTESIMQTMTELHKDIVQKIESEKLTKDNEEISLILEVDKEIHTIQDSIKSLENNEAAKVIKKIIKPMEDIEKAIHHVLSSEIDTSQKEVITKDINSNISSMESALDCFINIKSDIVLTSELLNTNINESVQLAIELRSLLSLKSDDFLKDILKTEKIYKLKNILSRIDWFKIESYSDGKNAIEIARFTRVFQIIYQLIAELSNDQLGYRFENKLHKESTAQLLHHIDQYIELIEIVEEISTIVKLEDPNETFKIARELRENIAAIEKIPAEEQSPDIVGNAHVEQIRLAEILQKAISALKVQVLDNTQELAPVLNIDNLQKIAQVTSVLQENLVTVTGAQIAVEAPVPLTKTPKSADAKHTSKYIVSDSLESIIKEQGTETDKTKLPPQEVLEGTETLQKLSVLYDEAETVQPVSYKHPTDTDETAIISTQVISSTVSEKTDDISIDQVKSLSLRDVDLSLSVTDEHKAATSTEGTLDITALKPSLDHNVAEKISDTIIAKSKQSEFTETIEKDKHETVMQIEKIEAVLTPQGNLMHHINEYVSDDIIEVVKQLSSVMYAEELKQSINIAKELRENIAAIETNAGDLLSSHEHVNLLHRLENALSVLNEQTPEAFHKLVPSINKDIIEKVIELTQHLKTDIASITCSQKDIIFAPRVQQSNLELTTQLTTDTPEVTNLLGEIIDTPIAIADSTLKDPHFTQQESTSEVAVKQIVCEEYKNTLRREENHDAEPPSSGEKEILLTKDASLANKPHMTQYSTSVQENLKHKNKSDTQELESLSPFHKTDTVVVKEDLEETMMTDQKCSLESATPKSVSSSEENNMLPVQTDAKQETEITEAMMEVDDGLKIVHAAEVTSGTFALAAIETLIQNIDMFLSDNIFQTISDLQDTVITNNFKQSIETAKALKEIIQIKANELQYSTAEEELDFEQVTLAQQLQHTLCNVSLKQLLNETVNYSFDLIQETRRVSHVISQLVENLAIFVKCIDNACETQINKKECFVAELSETVLRETTKPFEQFYDAPTSVDNKLASSELIATEVAVLTVFEHSSDERMKDESNVEKGAHEKDSVIFAVTDAIDSASIYEANVIEDDEIKNEAYLVQDDVSNFSELATTKTNEHFIENNLTKNIFASTLPNVTDNTVKEKDFIFDSTPDSSELKCTTVLLQPVELNEEIRGKIDTVEEDNTSISVCDNKLTSDFTIEIFTNSKDVEIAGPDALVLKRDALPAALPMNAENLRESVLVPNDNDQNESSLFSVSATPIVFTSQSSDEINTLRTTEDDMHNNSVGSQICLPHLSKLPSSEFIATKKCEDIVLEHFECKDVAASDKSCLSGVCEELCKTNLRDDAQFESKIPEIEKDKLNLVAPISTEIIDETIFEQIENSVKQNKESDAQTHILKPDNLSISDLKAYEITEATHLEQYETIEGERNVKEYAVIGMVSDPLTSHTEVINRAEVTTINENSHNIEICVKSEPCLSLESGKTGISKHTVLHEQVCDASESNVGYAAQLVDTSAQLDPTGTVTSVYDIKTKYDTSDNEIGINQLFFKEENISRQCTLLANERSNLLQHIDAFITDEVTEIVNEISNITNIEILKESVLIAKKLRESIVSIDLTATAEDVGHCQESNLREQSQLAHILQDSLSTLHIKALDSAEIIAPVLSSNSLQKVSEIISNLQEDLNIETASRSSENCIIKSGSCDAVEESKSSLEQLETLLQDVNRKLILTSTDGTTESGDALKDTLDEVQTVIIKLKRDCDGAVNDTLNETLEDLECSVRSVQLQINEDSPPKLLAEACATLQLFVENMNSSRMQISKNMNKPQSTENIIKKCSIETEETVSLIDIASKLDVQGSSHLKSIVDKLKVIKDSLKSLRGTFLVDANTVIEYGINIIENLEQLEENIYTLEKELDSTEKICSNLRDSIITAVHSVYGSISNMRGTVSSVQKRYMFENYGKPAESLLHAIKNIAVISSLESEIENRENWKKLSKSLRKVLNHFEDIKFYINLDKTARLPSDAAFTKIILDDLKSNITSILYPRAMLIGSNVLEKVKTSLECVEINLTRIESDTSLEVKDKIPMFKEIANEMISSTNLMKQNLEYTSETSEKSSGNIMNLRNTLVEEPDYFNQPSQNTQINEPAPKALQITDNNVIQSNITETIISKVVDEKLPSTSSLGSTEALLLNEDQSAVDEVKIESSVFGIIQEISLETIQDNLQETIAFNTEKQPTDAVLQSIENDKLDHAQTSQVLSKEMAGFSSAEEQILQETVKLKSKLEENIQKKELDYEKGECSKTFTQLIKTQDEIELHDLKITSTAAETEQEPKGIFKKNAGFSVENITEEPVHLFTEDTKVKILKDELIKSEDSLSNDNKLQVISNKTGQISQLLEVTEENREIQHVHENTQYLELEQKEEMLSKNEIKLTDKADTLFKMEITEILHKEKQEQNEFSTKQHEAVEKNKEAILVPKDEKSNEPNELEELQALDKKENKEADMTDKQTVASMQNDKDEELLVIKTNEVIENSIKETAEKTKTETKHKQNEEGTHIENEKEEVFAGKGDIMTLTAEDKVKLKEVDNVVHLQKEKENEDTFGQKEKESKIAAKTTKEDNKQNDKQKNVKQEETEEHKKKSAQKEREKEVSLQTEKEKQKEAAKAAEILNKEGEPSEKDEKVGLQNEQDVYDGVEIPEKNIECKDTGEKEPSQMKIKEQQKFIQRSNEATETSETVDIKRETVEETCAQKETDKRQQISEKENNAHIKIQVKADQTCLEKDFQEEAEEKSERKVEQNQKVETAHCQRGREEQEASEKEKQTAGPEAEDTRLLKDIGYQEDVKKAEQEAVGTEKEARNEMEKDEQQIAEIAKQLAERREKEEHLQKEKVKYEAAANAKQEVDTQEKDINARFQKEKQEQETVEEAKQIYEQKEKKTKIQKEKEERECSEEAKQTAEQKEVKIQKEKDEQEAFERAIQEAEQKEKDKRFVKEKEEQEDVEKAKLEAEHAETEANFEKEKQQAAEYAKQQAERKQNEDRTQKEKEERERAEEAKQKAKQKEAKIQKKKGKQEAVDGAIQEAEQIEKDKRFVKEKEEQEGVVKAKLEAEHAGTEASIQKEKQQAAEEVKKEKAERKENEDRIQNEKDERECAEEAKQKAEQKEVKIQKEKDEQEAFERAIQEAEQKEKDKRFVKEKEEQEGVVKAKLEAEHAGTEASIQKEKQQAAEEVKKKAERKENEDRIQNEKDERECAEEAKQKAEQKEVKIQKEKDEQEAFERALQEAEQKEKDKRFVKEKEEQEGIEKAKLEAEHAETEANIQKEKQQAAEEAKQQNERKQNEDRTQKEKEKRDCAEEAKQKAKQKEAEIQKKKEKQEALDRAIQEAEQIEKDKRFVKEKEEQEGVVKAKLEAEHAGTEASIQKEKQQAAEEVKKKAERKENEDRIQNENDERERAEEAKQKAKQKEAKIQKKKEKQEAVDRAIQEAEQIEKDKRFVKEKEEQEDVEKAKLEAEHAETEANFEKEKQQAAEEVKKKAERKENEDRIQNENDERERAEEAKQKAKQKEAKIQKKKEKQEAVDRAIQEAEQIEKDKRFVKEKEEQEDVEKAKLEAEHAETEANFEKEKQQAAEEVKKKAERKENEDRIQNENDERERAEEAKQKAKQKEAKIQKKKEKQEAVDRAIQEAEQIEKDKRFVKEKEEQEGVEKAKLEAEHAETEANIQKEKQQTAEEAKQQAERKQNEDRTQKEKEDREYAEEAKQKADQKEAQIQEKKKDLDLAEKAKQKAEQKLDRIQKEDKVSDKAKQEIERTAKEAIIQNKHDEQETCEKEKQKAERTEKKACLLKEKQQQENANKVVKETIQNDEREHTEKVKKEAVHKDKEQTEAVEHAKHEAEHRNKEQNHQKEKQKVENAGKDRNEAEQIGKVELALIQKEKLEQQEPAKKAKEESELKNREHSAHSRKEKRTLVKKETAEVADKEVENNEEEEKLRLQKKKDEEEAFAKNLNECTEKARDAPEIKHNNNNERKQKQVEAIRSEKERAKRGKINKKEEDKINQEVNKAKLEQKHEKEHVDKTQNIKSTTIEFAASDTKQKDNFVKENRLTSSIELDDSDENTRKDKYTDKLDKMKRQADELHIYRKYSDSTKKENGDVCHHKERDVSHKQHYIKEYQYEPSPVGQNFEARDKSRFLDHRDYTMEFARPTGYRERSNFNQSENLFQRDTTNLPTTIYKAQTIVLDAQLRSSAPPYPETIPSRVSDHSERRENRHRSKALSEARSATTERRIGLSRDSKRKPVFSTYLTDRTAVEGSRVKLTCSVLSSSDPKMTWYKNGVLLDNKLKYRTKFIDGLITLEVLNAVPSDSAEYSCTIENENGSVSSSANLKVYPSFEASPIPPTFTRSIRDTYYLAENELVLECRIRGQPLPTITWLKDDKSINSNSRYQAYYLADGVCRLAIESPTPEDSGKYTCKAENSVWSDQITHVVNYTGRENQLSPNIATIEKSRFHRQSLESRRPHFTNVLNDYKVVKGGTIGLQVEIRGAPTRVEWLREGCSITEIYRNASTFVDQELYTLALSDVTEKESGMYTCRAWSAHGNVDMNAAITVVQPNELEGKPAVIVGRPEKDILISVGEDINISFRVQGEPRPKVIFMKGIRDITTSQRVCKMTSDDYVKFTLKRSVIADAGTYCILVRNAYGCDRAFVTVVVRQRASSDNLISDWTYPVDDTAHSVEDRKYKSVPERIPGEPRVVEGGNNWISLGWPKPELGPSAPVLAYKVESWLLGKEGGARWVELGITPLNSFDVFNLKQGEEYHFRITPRNRYGWGESVQTSSPIGVGVAGDRPEFSVFLPGQFKVLVGETAKLSCTVKGRPTPEVVWMKNGHEVEDEDRRVSTSFNGFDCCLTIKDINIEDEARYSCEATNVHGRASTYARLAVVTDRSIWEADAKLKRERSADMKGDFPPQFTMRLRDRRVQATYPVRLTCQVIGSPDPGITWFKDGEEVVPDSRRSHFQDEHFHTLEIAPTTLEDGGVYEAMARNTSGAVSCHCNLVVDKGIRAYVAPEFCCGLEPLYRLTDGEELRISAVVEAYPSVGVTWYRDGVRLRPSRRAIMTLDRDGQTELALASVTPRDAGVYTCTASNEVGRASTSGKVEVIGENVKRPLPMLVSPDVPYSKEPMFIRKPRSSEAREGDTVIIECEVVGDPKPDVYWLRDFLKPDYYRDSSHFKRLGDGPQYRFEIPHAKLDYTGAYSVVATNTHGEAKAVISLQILAKDPASSDEAHNVRYGRVEVLPRFEKELTDLLSCDGDAVEFECRVSAHPEPDVRWFHYHELIRDCADFETSFEEGAARLKIVQVAAEDEGAYTCEAANNLGKVTSSACLVVYPPGEPNTLSQRLRRPPALLSAASTPRSTPRNTPARSVSRTPGPEPRRLCSPARMSAPAFYTYPFNKVTEEGDNITIQCAIKGNPAPWATWDKDGVIITPSARISIKEKDEVLRVLEIDQVTIEDVGVYRITIENELGRAEASARLEVITHKGKFYAGVRAVSPSPRTALTYRGRRPSTPTQH